MPINVPGATLSHLGRAPLRLAVAQVRYTPVHAVEKRDLVADFETALDSRFVAREAQHTQSVRVVLGAPGQPVGAAPPGFPFLPEVVWPFRDEERGYEIALANSSLALQISDEYHDFPTFLTEFGEVLRAFVAIFHPKRRLRVGLRYVNEIDEPRFANPAYLVNVIDAGLLSPVGGAFGSDLVASLAELRFREKHGVFVLRHGLVDQTKYLLDLDYFQEEEDVFSPDAILDLICRFHELIEAVFVWCLKPEYLRKIKRVRRGR